MQGGGCKTCNKPLSPRNRSGYCTRHVAAAKALDPVWRARQREGVARVIRENPARLEVLRRQLRAVSTTPEIIERKRQRAKDMGLAEIGRAHLTPESRAKAAIRQSETKMAWCPRERREEYRRLVYSKKLPAAEARSIILEQHERELAAFRRKLLAQAA